MSRAHTITTTTIDRWLLPHIAGITAYADTNPSFGAMLATWLDEENWSITPVPDVQTSKHLTPANQEQAEDILDWLMHELVTHPEARIARSLLVAWAGDYQAPQDLIWGLALTDTFGPTVTGQPSKKQPTSHLQIIIDQDWQETLPYHKLGEATHQLTQKLIAVELRKAGGKVGSLHPDTAEWCMGSAKTIVHAAPQQTLQAVQAAAEQEDVHHVAEQDAEGLTLVAVSPHVNDDFVNKHLGSAA